MTLATYKFETIQVRTLGTAETPLFVAIDVATALGYAVPKTAVAKVVDAEDIVKAEITDSMGRTQTVNCVTESGLYALIFGSKLESAKRFKRWVTSEVLPAIRKTGQYRCATTPQIPSEYLTLEHQYRIQSEVAKRVHKDDVRYQTVYQALKAHFRVPKYTYILEKDFEAAVKFIQTSQLQQAEEAPKKLPPSEETHIWVSRDILKRLSIFVYCLRYLCNKPLMQAMRVMEALNIPDASKLWDAVNDLNLIMMERELARFGYDPKELPAYKAWIAQQA
ncbi:BRO family protein [Duodenibacillus massiliensis]|uniref:BRO family protein n=1 Tax=Duodenibacillus massiliensis TaxID=1852381 RepID=UPI003A90A67C